MEDTDIIKRAAAFAAMAHADQKYGGRPYTTHTYAVARILAKFGFKHPTFQAAGFLHDTLEDTDTTKEMLVAEFGDDIAELVYAVTDEPGHNRRDRHKKTYPKIKAVPGAVVLKLADRIANVQSCWLHLDSRLFMYRDEYGGFREALFDESTSRTVLKMWAELDRLLGWDEWAARAYARRKNR